MAFENLKKRGIKDVLTMLKDHFLLIKDAVKSVNGVEADETGDIPLNVVPFAQNLESESSQRNYGYFIQRMAGGDTGLQDGSAWLLNLKGSNTHEGYVPEFLEMTVNAVERANPITAVIDRDTFVAYVSESGTITLVYSSGAWTTDPTLYGITVTGTPVDGDIITVDYTAEERGEIIVPNPQALIATGWNLYNHNAGYARVCKYAFGYRIEGTYTSLQYSATESGAKSEIVVTDGNFDIPDDGFVWVNGGSSSDTAVFATWEDWSEEHDGDFEAYIESVIDLSTVMASKFPYGLLKAGSVVDELDLNLGQAISRVERMTYSEANLAIAKASGREYEYDEDYIYLARASASVSTVSIDGSFTASDHGIEFFANADAPVTAEILYGLNLKNRLEREVLLKSRQLRAFSLSVMRCLSSVIRLQGNPGFGRFNHMLAEYRRRDRADAGRNGADGRNNRLDSLKVHVADQLPLLFWQTVTVASAAIRSMATGRPMTRLRPMTTARFPARSIP